MRWVSGSLFFRKWVFFYEIRDGRKYSIVFGGIRRFGSFFFVSFYLIKVLSEGWGKCVDEVVVLSGWVRFFVYRVYKGGEGVDF